MKILISRCLLGENCRYDGKSKSYEGIEALKCKHTLIPVCPETDGGLSVPRPPAEIVGSRVINKEGTDVTAEYVLGAQKALESAKRNGCTLAILKSRSPSCGKGLVYDGTFSGTLTAGDGVCAKLLSDNGITVISEEKIADYPSLRND